MFYAMLDSLTGPLCVTFIIGIFSLVLLYLYSVRNHDYWKKRGVKQAKTVPFLGSVYHVIKEQFQDVELKRYNELGAIYGHYELQRPMLSIADPFLIKDILIKDFQYFKNRREMKTDDKITDSMLSMAQGDVWKRLRTIVSPTFSTGKIKRMVGILKDCAATAMKNFYKEGKSSDAVDTKRIFGAFTMDVIASSAFSTKLDSHNDPDNEFVQKARIAFQQGFSLRFLFFILFPRLAKFLRLTFFNADLMDFFKNATFRIMEERKKTGQVRNDFLQLLMDTAKEVNDEPITEKESSDDISNYETGGTNPHIFKSVTSKNLSMDELVAQCVIFFLAGYETTASTLAFASYLLALNTDVQDKLRAEVDEALQKTNGELTYECVQSLKYLDNVISETLRLYPPGIRLERTAEVSYNLADTGITIEKDTIVTIPIYALHRDPQYFPDPERFDPDRFNPEEKSKRNPYVYLPFGAGPRNCVAMRFALVEIKIALVEVVRNFVIKRCSKTKVPLEFNMGQGLLQPKSIFLNMEPRDGTPTIK